jgi:PAS domain S-box-containing protein
MSAKLLSSLRALATRRNALLLLLLALNFSALVDSWLHPEIPYLDPEHLIQWAVYAVLVGTLYVMGAVSEARRAKAERTLRESERRYREFAEQVPQMVFELDAQGRCLFVNRSAQETLGYTPDELYALPGFLPLIVPEERPRALADMQCRLRGEALGGVEFTTLRKDGTTFPTLAFVERVMRAGEVVGMRGVIVDITERKRSETQLRDLNLTLERKVSERTAELEQALHTLQVMIETTDTGYVIIDGEGKVLDANREYVRLSGHGELREIRGRSVVEWTAAYEREKNAAAVAQCVRDGGIRNLEVDYCDGEGRVTPVEINASVMEADGVTRILSLCRDISLRRKAQQDLRGAKEAAEAASLAKSELLSRVSHELRTPLNAILGFAQLLEMRPLPEEDRERAGRILKAGRHLLALIDAVLDLTRAQDGRLALSPEPVPLSDLVREAAALWRAQADQLDILLEIDAPTLERRVARADRERLKQVLLNLLSNAVTYNRAGGRVTVGAGPACAGAVRLFVRDTGPGIPAALQERLFRPFERLNLNPERESGAGVGLALCRCLVEAMGGTIGLVSAEGEGSTFWVELPAAEVPASPSPPRVAEAAAPGVEPKVPPVTKTLLYVEDNLANHALLRDIVAHRPGLTLLTAMQGRLALELALRHRPDLVLLDLHLPDINGDEVLRRLREKSETRGIPVVILSAESSPGQQQRLLAAGAQRCLAKPLDLPVFLSTLDELLAGPARDDRPKED